MDVDGITGQAEQTDASVSEQINNDGVQASAQGEEASQQAIADALLELDGQKYSETDIRTWREAHQNMSKWRGELSKKGEEVNAMARALEQGRQAMLQQQPAYVPSNQNANINAPSPEQLVPVLQAAILEGDPQALGQLTEWITNLATQSATTQVSTVNEHQAIRQKFLSEHPDFETTMADQNFNEFARSRPEFNQVNAYFAYQLQQAKSQVEEAKKAGYLQGEQNAIRNLQAKGNLKILKGGASAPSASQPDLTNMNRHDMTLHIANKIMEARAQTGG